MATVVLIHGAFQGGWIWKEVATRLRGAEALGARWDELDTGHFPMLTMPDALT